METRASYILVGSFVLVLVAAIFGFAIWLAKVEFEAVPKRYVIYFSGSVTGLSIGSPVRYRGVPVGSVSDIRIDPKNVERIRVITDVEDGTPVKQDTRASLGLQGITGVAYILLSGGTHDSKQLTAKSSEDLPEIISEVSGLETVMEMAPEIFEKVIVLVDQLTKLVDDSNIKSISGTLNNLRSLSDTLAQRRDNIDRILTLGEDTLTELRDVVGNMNKVTTDFSAKSARLTDSFGDAVTDVQVTLSDIRNSAQSFSKLADKLDNVVDENRVAVQDFASGGLYELTQFLAEARLLVAGLTRLSNQLEQDPSRFLFGDTQKGFEVK
ncbi:MAG: MlaD family protein [Pseudomonadota bacterium]|nr:MlaD family protein [Pseudomonadota bacterium]